MRTTRHARRGDRLHRLSAIADRGARHRSAPAYLAALLLLAALGALPSPTAAHHIVRVHNPLCDTVFPCSEQLRTRVNFWIEVFASWTTRDSVFHDSRHPERVYRVVRTKNGSCSRRSKSKTLSSEHSRIRTMLSELADKVEQGGVHFSEDEQHILSLFPGGDSEDMRRAMRSIRCQQGNHDRFQDALQRFGTYHEMVREALQTAGLPQDIQYLPFVESAYNPFAYSRVGAAGLWQIMPRTGRNLGLRLNATVDERLDPESATHAAAKYLVDSEKSLRATAAAHAGAGDKSIYPFVITSYNYGVAGMRRAVKQFGLNFDQVLDQYKSPRFQIAVKNFYASFLAARHVARNADSYFGKVAAHKPLRYQTYVVRNAIPVNRLARAFGLKKEQIKNLNPALTRYIWNGWRFVPSGYHLRLPWRNHGWKRQIARVEKLPPQSEDFGGVRYKVRKGDTACGIARAFRVNCRQLMAVNNLNRRGLIRIGQRLTIPSTRGAATAAAKPAVTTGTAIKYTVRSGDSVCGIARRHGVDCGEVLKTNDIGRNGLIHPGQVLQLLVASQPASTPPPAPPPGAGADKPAAPDDRQYLATLDQPTNYTVYKGADNDSFYIIVLPDESLGHYADWMGLGRTGAASIRRLNGINRGSGVNIGKSIVLPLQEQTGIQRFQEKRRDYHGALIEAFKEHYRIEALDKYSVITGDSLWKIARSKQVPLWVLMRFNPEVVRKPLVAGQTLEVPVLTERN